MPKISLLTAWLDRQEPLRSFINIEHRPPSQEFGGFLSLDVVVPVHDAATLEAESLAISWQKTHAYVVKALELIEAEEPLCLDRYESELIRSELGEPPPLCYPIYLITVGDGPTETLVYVGKTSSNQGRFRGGHAAFTKLLHPDYDGQAKRVYLGAIVLLDSEKSYIPLEWIKPVEGAEALLSSIEAQIIFRLKPDLNVHHVNSDNASWPVSIHIQNFTGATEFLHDEFLWP